MNYRHAYHAGNFADVLKHAVLALVIEHLKLKPTPFRVIDTHAGVGAYDLGSEEAQKTGEWREGIGRIVDADLPPDSAAVLAPYLGVVRGLDPRIAREGTLTRYPGSPLLARRLMREGDHLVANELHPEDNIVLRKLFGHDPQTKVLEFDGWTALKSLLPPKERRGVVLVDPAYEQPGELERLVQGLKEAARRFATGTILLWYPIKDVTVIAQLRRQVAGLELPKALAVELLIRAPHDPDRLNGAGLVVVNPPFTLAAKLALLLPELARLLAQGPGATFRIEELGRDAVPAAKPRA
jgi:23S rRNA (adenine2030-N6)-methyltransferase